MRGLRTDFYYMLLLCLTAMTVVLLSTVVGIIMVIALLTLPAGSASVFCRRLSGVMVWAVLLSMALTSGGLYLSYGPDLPTGAVIIVLAGAVYLVSATVAWLRRS